MVRRNSYAVDVKQTDTAGVAPLNVPPPGVPPPTLLLALPDATLPELSELDTCEQELHRLE